MFAVEMGALITLIIPSSVLIGVMIGMVVRGWLDGIDERSGFITPRESGDDGEHNEF